MTTFGTNIKFMRSLYKKLKNNNTKEHTFLCKIGVENGKE